MVLDYLGRCIDLEQVVQQNTVNAKKLLHPPAKNQKQWDKFHLDYVLKVGPIVGFKRTVNSQKLTRPERKVFERIFQEFFHQEFLQELFGSYENFFYCFFMHPYSINPDMTDNLPRIQQELDNKRLRHTRAGSLEEKTSLEQEVNTLREQTDILKFARTLNFPALLYECLELSAKRSSFRSKDEEITYQTSDEVVHTTVRAEITNIVWDYLFSGSDDCIFIDIKDKSHVSFTKYWFASLLHYLNPNFVYLDFRTPSEKVPLSLFRAKLMQCQDRDETRYLVVGGILGEDFRRIKDKKAEQFVDEAIRNYFLKCFTKRDRLFYNFHHVPNPHRPYNQFVAYVKERYGVNEDKLRKIGKIKGIEFTHHLRMGWDEEVISRISNVDEEGQDKFQGEQYSETFEANKTGKVGSFTKLEGMVRGFDMSYNKIRRPFFKKLIIGGLAGLLLFPSLINYGIIKLKEESDSREYIFDRLVVNEREATPLIHVVEGVWMQGLFTITEKARKKRIVSDSISTESLVIGPITEEEIITRIPVILRELCDDGSVSDKDCTKLMGETQEDVLDRTYLDRKGLCAEVGIDPEEKELLCGVKYIFRNPIYEEESFSKEHVGEEVRINLNTIFEVKAVSVREPRPLSWYIPFIIGDNYTVESIVSPGIELKTSEGQYLLTGTGRLSFNQKSLLVGEFERLFSEYIKIRNNAHTNLFSEEYIQKKCDARGDANFKSKMEEILKRMGECKDSDDESYPYEPRHLIIIKTLCDGSKVNYEIVCQLNECVNFGCEGMSKEDAECWCEDYVDETTVFINTKSIQSVEVSHSDLHTSEDSEITPVYIGHISHGFASYHLPFKDAKRLEQLLIPFTRQNSLRDK